MKKIVQPWDALQSQMQAYHLTREQVLEDQFAQWAVTTPIYNIGEQVYCVSKELKERFPELPWSMVAGLRHRLVHDYEGINWSIIVAVIWEEMDPFVDAIQKILVQMP